MKELTKKELKILKFFIQLLNLMRKIGVFLFAGLFIIKGYSIVTVGMKANTFQAVAKSEWLLFGFYIFSIVLLYFLKNVVRNYLEQVKRKLRSLNHFSEDELKRYKEDMEKGEMETYGMEEIIAKKEYIEARGEAVYFNKEIRDIIYFRSPPVIECTYQEERLADSKEVFVEDEIRSTEENIENSIEESFHDAPTKVNVEEGVIPLFFVAIIFKVILSIGLTYFLFRKFTTLSVPGLEGVVVKILCFGGIYSLVSYYGWYLKSIRDEKTKRVHWRDAQPGGFLGILLEYIGIPIIVLVLVFGLYSWILSKVIPESMQESAYMLFSFFLMIVPLIKDLFTIFKSLKTNEQIKNKGKIEK